MGDKTAPIEPKQRLPNLDVDTGNEGTEDGATAESKRAIRSQARAYRRDHPVKHCAPLSRKGIPPSKTHRTKSLPHGRLYRLRNAASIID